MRARRDGRPARDPKADSQSPTHHRAIYAALAAVGAAALLLTACEDLNLPGAGVATSDLVILPLQAGAPAPGGLSFHVYNRATTTRSLIHGDGFNTLFATLQFPSGSLASLDGVTLGLGDSVLVTITPEAGAYGVQLAPEGLRFASLGRPVLTFSYPKYGDFSVAAGTRFADPSAYAAALAVWRETSLDRWASVGASGNPGTDVTASLSQGGRYLVAAQR